MDGAKLSLTLVSIGIMNPMSDEALSNKCFIMPKALNSLKTKSVLHGKKLAVQLRNILE